MYFVLCDATSASSGTSTKSIKTGLIRSCAAPSHAHLSDV